MYQYALFDLDGTLTDSKEGILKSLVYAFEKLGDPVPDHDTLLRFIGPPMEVSFPLYCGYDAKRTRLAVDTFRERYAPIGVYENTPAEGIIEMFQRLTEKGIVLAVASSKPHGMCVKVCDRFGFTPYMRAIVGSPLTEDWDKARVIRETMSRLGIGEAEKPLTVMVGDRKYDAEGAIKCGVDCIGVEFFGYAEPGELKAAGAVRVARTVSELEAAILEGPAAPGESA
ncbi:MAG: HAD hydrolase-like protein [Oscillospiraceae bacterium]|nr:HAD hydrolase-like protein [Oscillospiraceae bacterium]